MIKDVSYSERGVQVVFSESIRYHKMEVHDPIESIKGRLRVIAEKILPPVTRGTELVEIRSKLSEWTKEYQFSWEWRE